MGHLSMAQNFTKNFIISHTWLCVLQLTRTKVMEAVHSSVVFITFIIQRTNVSRLPIGISPGPLVSSPPTANREVNTLKPSHT